MIIILNLFKSNKSKFLDNLVRISNYVDNDERDFTFVYKHNVLDIEYIIKTRDFCEMYVFFVLDSKNEECLLEVENFLKFLKKQANIDIDKLFSDIRTFDIKNISDYLTSQKICKYNLILDKLDNDIIKIGFFYEDKKLKKMNIKKQKMYNKNMCYESLFNTLLFYIEELSINTSNIEIIEKPSIDFLDSFLNESIKDTKNIYYLVKKNYSKNFLVKTKDKKNDIYFDFKYDDIENIEFSFYFNKTKRGLVTPLLSRLNTFSINKVSWNKLYDLYCDKKPSKVIVKNLYLEGLVEKILVLKKYEMVCEVTDDKDNVYFKMNLKEIEHDPKYYIN